MTELYLINTSAHRTDWDGLWIETLKNIGVLTPVTIDYTSDIDAAIEAHPGLNLDRESAAFLLGLNAGIAIGTPPDSVEENRQ